jgi:hypothetical protein
VRTVVAPRIALLALLALAGGAALHGAAGPGSSRVPEGTPPPPQVSPTDPAAPAPAEGKGVPPAAAAAADPDVPVTILYTIHNTGYIEPCG